jgi:hypothetical protein
MPPAIEDLHDATLTAIHFEWSSRICTLFFAGAPQHSSPFAFIFTGVTDLRVPAALSWGSSVSVLEAQASAGEYRFSMQSGDTITVVGSNYVSKPTAGDGLQLLQLLSAGSGLTRR